MDVRVRSGAGPARRAAGRTDQRAPCTPDRRSGRTLRTARTSMRRRRRGRGPAAAERLSPIRSSWCRRGSARCAGHQRRTPRPPRLPRRPRCGVAPRPSQFVSGHTRRASRTRPRPCAREATRAAGDGVRASVSRSAAATDSEPACTAAATDAVTSPWVRDPATEERAQRIEIDDQATGHRFFDAAGVHVSARRQPGVRQGQQRCQTRHQNRKYRCAMGNSSGGLLLPDLAVDAHRKGVGLDFDPRPCVVERHVGLADTADVADRRQGGD